MHQRASFDYQAWARERLRPSLLTRDREKAFDHVLWRELAVTGFFRLALPPADGGLGYAFPGVVQAFCALGRGSLDLPLCVSAVAQVIAVDLISRFGNADQKACYLPSLVEGHSIAAVCNSEPGAGTDLKAIRSSMSQTGISSASLDIEKKGATNLGRANVLLCSVWRKAEGTKPSLEVVLVDGKDSDQESLVERLSGFYTGLTGSVSVRNVAVDPGVAQLGEPFSGFKILRHCFNMERLLIGAIVSGILGELAREAVAETTTRQSFGKAIANFQYVQEKVLTIYVAHARLSSLVSAIASPSLVSPDELVGYTKLLSVLKMATIDDAGQALAAFFEIFGFLSYTLVNPAQKLLRDHLALRCLGGTREQQKMLLFQELAQEAS